MGHRRNDSDEQHEQEGSHGNAGVYNEISGGHFGNVAQVGYVSGDVNIGPPRSPEEAAFRVRYMAKMQEAWDAEEWLQAHDARVHAHQRSSNRGCGLVATAFLLVVVFIVIAVIWMARNLPSSEIHPQQEPPHTSDVWMPTPGR
ncbi:hypothetical protein [Saccharopolyspora shandongensis]|uniref:hypothetical protein n=1 Tax=Saccharopolyspora shandongensis TaxID=418495 RepID=UPI00340137A0